MMKRFYITLLCFLTLTCLLSATTAHAQTETPIDPVLWTVTSSASDKKAHLAIDGSLETRWDSGRSQTPGEWFQIDLGENLALNRVEIDTAESKGDYPREYEFSASPDGTNWTVIDQGRGEPLLVLSLPADQKFRYLKISIPESGSLSSGFWSIHEIRAYSSDPSTTAAKPEIRWRIIKPEFPTRDTVIAGYDIRDFGVDPAKGEDITRAVRMATSLLSRAGGGTLWLPSGRYRLSEPIALRNNVSIRGDWQKPVPGQPIRGTILEMTAGRGEADSASGISLYEASAVKGVAIWYPEQDAAKIVPYPAALKQFGGVGMAVENVTFVNAYRGFVCGPESCALYFLRNLYGTVLETAIAIDSTVDIGRLEMARFSPDYWAGSGLPGAPAANGPHVTWMRENGSGLVFRRNDWSYAYDVEIKGYKVGLRTLPSLGHEDVSKNRKSYPNGNNALFRFENCGTAIQLENVSSAGFMLLQSEIKKCDVGLLAEATFTNTLQLMNCTITDTPAAMRLQGSGYIQVVSSEIGGTVENTTGAISFAGGRTTASATPGNASGAGRILMLPDPGMTVPPPPYRTPEDRFASSTDQLAVVTDPAFGAKGDAKTNDTEAIKKAIASVAAQGGTVFLPGGEYRVEESLVIPTGVELRGINEAPHHAQTRGSVIDVIPGRGELNAAPFITLSKQSGLRSLTFHYPDQDAPNIVPYPWMIRGAGEAVWVVNVSCTMAYQLLDLATVRCDRHYIDYVAGHALLEAFRIGGGSVGGRLLNCQLNPNYYAFTTSYANSPNRMSPRDSGKYMDPVYTYAKAKAQAFVIGDCVEQILFQNFVFGMKEGLVLTGNSGPSGWCLGHGSDQCRWGVLVDRIGAGGMPLLNSQLVSVKDNGPERGYVRLTKQFNGIANFSGLDAWGDPSNALLVEGGALNLASTVMSRTGQALLTITGGRAGITAASLRNTDVLVDRSAQVPLENVQVSGVLLQKEKGQNLYASLNEAPASLVTFSTPDAVRGVVFDSGQALPRGSWQAQTAINPKDIAKAIDGDPSTRWATGRALRVGDEITVDLGTPHRLSKVRIDTEASKNDYPPRLQIALSKDGQNWSEPVYSGPGESDFRVGFAPVEARYIRITSQSERGGFWSIHEIEAAE